MFSGENTADPPGSCCIMRELLGVVAEVVAVWLNPHWPWEEAPMPPNWERTCESGVYYCEKPPFYVFPKACFPVF